MSVLVLFITIVSLFRLLLLISLIAWPTRPCEKNSVFHIKQHVLIGSSLSYLLFLESFALRKIVAYWRTATNIFNNVCVLYLTGSDLLCR